MEKLKWIQSHGTPTPRDVSMRVLLIIISIVVTMSSSFGQGTIYFSNGPGGIGVDAPVTLGTTDLGPGADFTAQLMLVQAGGSLSALVPTTTFRSGAMNPVAGHYLLPIAVSVPGVAPGQDATFVIRAWQTALGSYENAVRAGYYFGQSPPVTVLAGPDNPPFPAVLTGLERFTIVVPEPEPLLLISAGALLITFRAFSWRR
jgi:hypothetical protein